jgi:uncharacterized protein (UPF0303 family)
MNLPDKIAKMMSPENDETRTYVIRKKKTAFKYFMSTYAELFSY